MANDTTNARGPDAVTHQLPAGELPAGWQLLEGQYEITRLIASGGFGITYLARDTLGRDVAVKECFPLGLAQRAAATHTVSATSAGTSEHFETARAQFLREARMLAALRHPNVVHVQTLFEENGTAYMAMDFIHGRDLHEEIVAGTIPPARVLDLARDLLGALEYVHGQSILHRDIKPQNIRIDRFGVPMLIDFGAARAETQARSRMAGTFRVVTDGYSPHEFYVAGAQQGPHSDLYAMAATLYHVITGAAPAPADERASALATGQPDPYSPIAGTAPAYDGRLLHLIDRALQMTPKDRPETASVWLTALTDAPTTLIAPVAAAPTRSRLIPGVLIGTLLMGGAGAAIWTMQPPWLAPAMGEMSERMDLLEQSLTDAEVARAVALADLETLQSTLSDAESELTRLEQASGDMTATMAELSSARDARDAALTRIANLETELESLATLQAALEQSATDLDTAMARADTATAQASALAADVTALEAAAEAAAAQIATLEAETEAAADQIETFAAATQAAADQIETLEADVAQAQVLAERVPELEEDLSEADTARSAALARQRTLEQELQQAFTDAAELSSLREEIAALDTALNTADSERMRLAALIDTMPETADLDALQAQITEVEAENAELQTALALAQDALAARVPPYDQTSTLRAPSGTFALLPRFSWDNIHIAAVDSTGGIALYDRETGAYRAHLARGLPDAITRLGFSSGGAYLIATTPNGTQNRLYDIAARREILRFESETVTTADRAISSDERWFVYTRAAASGRIEVVRLSLPDLAAGTSEETVLASVPDSANLRISFAETRNELFVVTADRVEVYDTEGNLLETSTNRMGQVAAMSPIGRDDGILILRRNGDVVIFDDVISQTQTAQVAARATYSRYRLSGNRLNFLRANGERWDVVNLLTGDIRGSGEMAAGYTDAFLALSADGTMIFIGASSGNPARIIAVADGAEIQQFDGAVEGYFSFDNQFLTTGGEDVSAASVWRLNEAYTMRNTDPQ